MMNASSVAGAPTYASNSIGLLAFYQPVAHQYGGSAAAFSVTQLPSNLTATQEAYQASEEFNNNYEDPVNQAALDQLNDQDGGGNNNTNDTANNDNNNNDNNNNDTNNNDTNNNDTNNNNPAGDAFSQDVAQSLEEQGYPPAMQQYAANVAKGINDNPNLTEKQKKDALEAALKDTFGTEMARTIANNAYPKEETQNINNEGAMGGLANPTI
jgi:hypothetical protein